MIQQKKHILSGWQVIVIGYLVVILLGSFLLSLPCAANSNQWTSYIDALFTATSATCVTGLVVSDVVTHWTLFGQIVIIVLIQIGGVGFMTIITLISMFLKRKIGLQERKYIMQSSGNMRISGMILLIKRIIISTAIIEIIGMLLLSIQFCQDFGISQGIYFAFFHSVSAFCNAGFDLMGSFASFTGYHSNPLVVLTLSFLIVSGGIGFIVWGDLYDSKFRFRHMMLHTRIVLIATALLIVLPTCLYLLFEYNHGFAGFTGSEMFLASLFSSISPRTAGFFIVDPTLLSDAGTTLTIVLMFIGGSTGSTAGGIKVTTFVIILFTLMASIRNTQDINIGKRRVDSSITRQALTIFSFYLLAITVSIMAICAIDGAPLKEVTFEVVSAICTVGLSLSLTPTLGVMSKLVLILLMYAGRVGLLTIALAIGEKHKKAPINRPLDKILVG